MNLTNPEILRYLDSQGKSSSGFPLYRLVWSDDQYEWRKGTFNEFSSGGLYLRTIVGVKLVPKYSFAQHRWILEKWFPPEMIACEELPNVGAENSYEPVFVFQDKNGNPLPVVLRVIEILVGYARNQERISSTQMASDDRDLERLSETKEYNELFDSIDTTPLQSQLHMREAIIKP